MRPSGKVVALILAIFAFIFILFNRVYHLSDQKSLIHSWCAHNKSNSLVMEDGNRSSFYATLLSNVKSHESHRENTVAHFVTKLADKITLNEEWEVGLSEISYTKSWYNISQNQSINVFTTNKQIWSNEEAVLRSGYYPTIEILIQEINKKFKVFESELYKKDVIRAPSLKYDSILNRIYVVNGITKNSEAFLYPPLSEELETMLGLRFNNEKTFESFFWDDEKSQMKPLESIDLKYRIDYGNAIKDSKNGQKILEYEAPYPVQFNICELHILVYCSIIEPVLVGNTYSKLLRQVEIPKRAKFNDQCVVRFQDPFYFPLVTNEFETVEIIIRDDTGALVPFNWGRSSVVLHFRKKNSDEFKSLHRLLH
jgi:hypothetical protein